MLAFTGVVLDRPRGQGNVHYYYEVEPLGVYLAEIITGSNITVFYDSGEDLVKAALAGVSAR
ncbi:hypothetical protein [Mycobacterium sp. E2733]|uniref:hypothetical protein n=1 Tax=Mycobacterium sp. E2733 TaxID=1834138 RepID=UPI0007FD9618|nr:hypothetical protein [Mycobacterium sp. E2733]OBH89420.1 hypothetical protein A5678_14430 [Mycobacterium sp. E2733]